MHLATGCSHQQKGNDCVLQSGAPSAVLYCFTVWREVVALHTKHKVKQRPWEWYTFKYILNTRFWLHDNVYLQAFIYQTPPSSQLRQTLESLPSLQTE